MRNLKQKTLFKFAWSLVLLFFMLASCKVGDDSDDHGFATWTPSPSATATCDSNMSMSTPSEWGETELIVILYDPRSETVGGQYIELANKEKIVNVSLFVDAIATRLIRPGGQVSVFQLGYSSYENARVARLYSYSNVPPLLNTPAPPQTLTPLPSPVMTLTPGFGRVATEQAMKIQATDRAATEAVSQANYGCNTDYWNKVVKLTATAWNGTATAEISEAEQGYATEVAKHENGVGIVETPFKTNELYYGGVYYGLGFATTIFQSECANYNKCTLIIIDDLQVWGKYNSENIPIDLTGVNVYAVMPNCLDLNQSNCADTKQYWSSELKRFGAVEILYFNGVRAESNLLNAIWR